MPKTLQTKCKTCFGHPQTPQMASVDFCFIFSTFWMLLTVHNTWEILETWLCRSPRLMDVALCTIYCCICVLEIGSEMNGKISRWAYNVGNWPNWNSLGVIFKSSSQEAISLRSSRKHILNLLTLVMFVSFVYIKLWTGIGPKAGRETWYSQWTGLTPAVGDTLTSRVTAFSSPTIHQEDVYTLRYVGSKDIKFCSENTF